MYTEMQNKRKRYCSHLSLLVRRLTSAFNHLLRSRGYSCAFVFIDPKNFIRRNLLGKKYHSYITSHEKIQINAETHNRNKTTLVQSQFSRIIQYECMISNASSMVLILCYHYHQIHTLLL